MYLPGLVCFSAAAMQLVILLATIMVPSFFSFVEVCRPCILIGSCTPFVAKQRMATQLDLWC